MLGTATEKVPFNFELHSSDKWKLEALARYQDRSMSAVLRSLVREAYRRLPADVRAEAQNGARPEMTPEAA